MGPVGASAECSRVPTCCQGTLLFRSPAHSILHSGSRSHPPNQGTVPTLQAHASGHPSAPRGRTSGVSLDTSYQHLLSHLCTRPQSPCKADKLLRCPVPNPDQTHSVHSLSWLNLFLTQFPPLMKEHTGGTCLSVVRTSTYLEVPPLCQL